MTKSQGQKSKYYNQSEYKFQRASDEDQGLSEVQGFPPHAIVSMVTLAVVNDDGDSSVIQA